MFKNLLLASGFAVAAGAAHATTSFELTIFGNTNVPDFSLTNTSDTALLTEFSITIGRLDRNFDFIQNVTNPAGGVTTLVTGDGINGGTRFDILELSFTDFDPSESVSWDADIDQDNTNVTRDYRTTLFNNAVTDNSVLSASFSDGSVISFELDNQTPGLSSYTFTGSAAPVPLPAGLPLMVMGVGAFAVMRRRKG